MRKSLLVVLMVLVLGSGVAFGQPSIIASGEATAHVYCNILASISVTLQQTTFDLDGTGNGFMAGQDIPCHIAFTVHANNQNVDLQVVATDLYKDNDATQSVNFIPISSTGATIACQHGGEIHNGTGVLEWQISPPGGMIPQNWTGKVSRTGTFGNGVGTFSQDVTVSLTWKTTNAEILTGDYEGTVKLIAMVMSP